MRPSQSRCRRPGRFGAALLATAGLVAMPAVAQGGENPLPAAIVKGELAVSATPFARAPRTTDPELAVGWPPAYSNDAYARIQTLLPVPDGSGRLAIYDVRGVFYMVDEEGGELTTYLDHRTADLGFDASNMPNESGFLGLAFHPEFGQAGEPGYGKFYTAYSASVESGVADYVEAPTNVQESVIREWTARDPAATVFAGTSREVLRVGQFAPNHNVGTLAFNPTAAAGSPDYGLLYACLGDGGAAQDPMDHGQRLATPLGAIVRIDPLAGAEGRAYGIPADNPFIDMDDAAPEIWAYGLRHPQQFSWDADGRMFIADIGQDSVEEINLGVAGGNYGWRLREGTFATIDAVGSLPGGPVYPRPETDPAPFIYPVAQYDHDEGFAIGGGFVYRGEAIPALRGKYVFTELVRGRLFAIDADNLVDDGATPIEEVRIHIDGEEIELAEVAGFPDTYKVGSMRVDARLGMDHDGELYLLTKSDGWIRKLSATGADAPVAQASGASAAQTWAETRRRWQPCADGSVALRGADCEGEAP